jgi:hypothetical protein
MCSDADRDKDMSIGEWRFTRRMSALRKQALSDYQAAIKIAATRRDHLISAAIAYSESMKMSKCKTLQATTVKRLPTSLK